MSTVTKDLIDSKIRQVYYINTGQVVSNSNQPRNQEDLAELNLVTICIIILESGFKVEGVSACIDPTKYDQKLGEQFAYENAYEKFWQLEGYKLKCELANQ